MKCPPGVIALYLHGSQASGSARPDSDLDLAILVPHGWSQERLGEALDALPPEADVQVLNDAPARFRARVVQHGKLLDVTDTTALARFQAYSILESYDEEYFVRPMHEAALRRLTGCLRTGAS